MPLFRAHKPRHAKPSKAVPVLAAGGMTATLSAAVSVGSTAEAASANDFKRLRMCESGGNYRINTGNGYYGAYQFDRRTWRGLGYSGMPHRAAPSTQDRAARELQADRGWQPWPACARKLGLGRKEVRASRSARSNRVKSRPAVSPRSAPAYRMPLTTKMVKTPRGDVKAWQARMVARGWDLAVDGRYGPRTARVAARFAAQKGLKAPVGVVNKAVWKGAWQLPIT